MCLNRKKTNVGDVPGFFVAIFKVVCECYAFLTRSRMYYFLSHFHYFCSMFHHFKKYEYILGKFWIKWILKNVKRLSKFEFCYKKFESFHFSSYIVNKRKTRKIVLHRWQPSGGWKLWRGAFFIPYRVILVRSQGVPINRLDPLFSGHLLWLFLLIWVPAGKY